ncbi:MAG: hypothetical protein RBT63_08030, partial [Bdellovibrionales bacterium]|nr:hypothetical protein [Bdellovibrionales bacterium]
HVINTSQFVPEKTSPAFSKIPSRSVEEFATMTNEQFAVHRGTTLSGRIPGDLVGVRLLESIEPSRTVASFLPAPVALIQKNGGPVTYGAFKPRGGSVEAFESVLLNISSQRQVSAISRNQRFTIN